MTKRQILRSLCDRCHQDTDATSTVQFCFGEHTHVLDLCERHAAMWEQDMLAWVRVARDADEPHGAPTKPEWVPGARYAPKVTLPERTPVVVHLEPDVTPWEGGPVKDPRLPEDTETWTFSSHAKQRMQERGISAADALWATADPAVTRAGREPELTVYERDDIKTVANAKRKVIVTVSRVTREAI